MADEVKGKLTDEELISKAYELFEEYRNAYDAEWSRLDECEALYQGKHWDNMNTGSTDSNDPKPVTPVFQSTVENIAADLMDMYPEAIIQPENPEDRTVADIVGALIRQNHDSMGYRREYRRLAHDILVSGYCVQEVGYDVNANYGIGSAFIRHIDNRNILFDPQCTDIQEGRAVFKLEPKTIQWLEQRYPDKAGQFAKDEYTPKKDAEVTYDQDKSVFLIEYWWREWDTTKGRYVVHMAKLAGKQLLEDSRTAKPDGYFSMGMYPFVVTPLYTRKGSALGYGIADMFGETQKYADKLDQITLKNAAMSSRNKLLVTHASGFDVEDLKDWSKDVHQGESLNGVTWFANPPLPQYIIQYASMMRENVKEESGSNDFSRGNAGSGITAASAIAALQEASSKRSRMIAGQLHEAFKDAIRMEIEFEREYNTLPREVLLTQNGEQITATFESAIMERETALGNMVPIELMISIKVQRASQWTITAHNEFILQMVQLQVIRPDQAVELLEFEGKEELLGKMRQGLEPTTEEAIQQQQMEQLSQEEMALQEQLQGMPSPVDVAGGE